MQFISYRQSLFLLSMILPVTGHMILLSPIIIMSGKDSWISIIFTVPIGFLGGFIIFRLHSLFPTKTIVEMVEEAFGLFLGKLIATGVILYFFYMILITFYVLHTFIQIIFLPETPEWAIAISFYFVVWFAISKGIEPIARICGVLFLFIIITGVSIALTTHEEKNYNNLFPLFENGISETLFGIGITTALFGELILLLMLKLKKENEKSKSLLFTNSMTVVLITFMFLGTVTSTLAIFGEDQAKSLEFPAQSIVRIVDYGFIERFDIYGIFTIVLGSVIRISALQWVLNLGIRQWLGLKKKWIIHAVISATVLIISLKLIENNAMFVHDVLIKIYPWTALCSLGIPLLTWIILEYKNRFKSRNS